MPLYPTAGGQATGGLTLEVVRLFYGATQVADTNAAKFSWSRQLLRNRAGIGVGLHWRCGLEQAILVCNGQTDARTKQLAIEEALSIEGQDLIFANDDGTPSGKSVLSALTLSGVRCTEGPIWSSRPGAQHQTWIEYAATWEWETRFESALTLLMEFHETLMIEGGTPRLVVLEPLNTRPVLQITVPQTGYRAVQIGSAIGVADRPNPYLLSPLIWPGNCDRDVTVQISGERVGPSYKDFGVQWHREYKSDTPLVGAPAEWRG